MAGKAPRSFVLWLRSAAAPGAAPGAARARAALARGFFSPCPRAPTSLSPAASGLFTMAACGASLRPGHGGGGTSEEKK